MGLSQIIFTLVTLLTFYFAYGQYKQIFSNIKLGKKEAFVKNPALRWKNLFLVAFGQKKMFKRPIPALLHLFIYVAFLFTQIELIEILIDGFWGTHRIFAPYLGFLYTLIINTVEFLSILAFIATLIFIIRRNVLKIERFHKPEMRGWPTFDANTILVLEIFLIIGIFSMNGADLILQHKDPLHFHDTGTLFLSSILSSPLLESLGTDMLMFIERSGWWLHLFVVFIFINYLPRSKHLHIFLAFPNVFFANLRSRGEMSNMPDVMNEVKSMMGLVPESAMNEPLSDELPEFGANDIFGLSERNILNAYSCTECGRCTSVCPANMTGKKLSPRKILMDIRDRADEVGRNLSDGYEKYIDTDKRKEGQKLNASNYSDGKNLFDYITKEELHACTACNACVEACPIMIDPLEPILELRRYEILTESAGPTDWLPMFTSIENSGSVWQIPDERQKWALDLEKED